MSLSEQNLTWHDFAKVDMRVGTVLDAEIFGEAHKPAYKITIDFGPIGIKKSSAQLTKLYKPTDLIGKQVIAVVNFPPKQIANMHSECLILGVVNDDEVTILSPEKQVSNGLRIG